LDEESGEEVVPRFSEDEMAWRNEADGRV